MRKTIRIFLASSIVEFKNERMEIENFIRNISDKFEDSYGIKIQPLLCENFDDAYSKVRKQEEYNDKIRQSDFCFFIFFTKAGEFTREEFEVARKKFEESGKPKIFTYFKVIKDEKAEQSLYDFMDELDKVFGHYYGEFENIDTIKLRILLSLKLQEMDFLEIKTEDGKCLVDGKPVLSLNNVSEFANNEILKQMQDELSAVEDEFFRLKSIYVSDDCDEDTERKYYKIASRRKELMDAIEELQKNIFNMSVHMCKDELHGEITPRQKAAYRLFEQGKIEEANKILDAEEMKNEFLQKQSVLKEECKKNARIYIGEIVTKIDVLTAMVENDGRFTEIEQLYDEIVKIAFEEKVKFDVVYDYVCFLNDQNKTKNAIEIGERLNKVYSETENVSDEDKAMLLNLLAASYDDQNLPQKAEMYYLKAMDIYENLAEEKPERFNPGLAMSYNNAGVFYKSQGQPQKAEMYDLKAIEIREKLVNENPEGFNPDLASSYNSAGCFYDDQGQTQKAETYYLKAIEIREKLAKDNPERFNLDLAMSYNNAGCFYDDQGQPQKVEMYYLKAIEIIEKLAKDNPERFNPDLAMSYNNAGIYYDDQGQTQKAEMYNLKAIEIRENLAEENPERFNPYLATSYNSAGCFYDDQGQPQNAEMYYLKAIEIRENLAKETPERFNFDLADSYNSTGAFYYKQGHMQKAERYFLEAIEIREKLAKDNPERFNPDLALSYYNAGTFYHKQGQSQKTEMYYLKAIEIRETLAKEKPERFNSDLAMSYNNAGCFYDDQGQPQKVEMYYLKAIEIIEKLARENPERFGPKLAVSYYNYALFTDKEEYYQKALELAKKYPDDPLCSQIVQIRNC